MRRKVWENIASLTQPERLVRTINQLTKERAESVLFAWSEVQAVRRDSRLYVFINDADRRAKNDVVKAFEE